MTDILSELSGTIWKIEVQVGQAVEVDDTIMLIESMKMEVPVLAPRKGKVKSIAVEENEVVTEGQVLASLE